MCKVYLYGRISTSEQRLDQQELVVSRWLESNNMTIDETISDVGISGKVSYKKRNLGRYLLPKMESGDILIVSEISRLGRSMRDLSNLIHTELKPIGIRLIIVTMGLDLDCRRMSSIDESILNNFAFASQLERELITSRVRAGVSAALKRGVKFGREKGCDTSKANRAAGTASTNRKLEWYSNSIMARDIKRMIDSGEYGEVIVNTINAQLQDEIELKKPIEHVTQKGLELTYKRLVNICDRGGWKAPRWNAERAIPQNDMGYEEVK